MLRNGEPYGELGLVINSDVDCAAQNGQPRDPVLILKQRDDDGRSDDGSSGFLAAPGPAASLWQIDHLQNIKPTPSALLHRIILLGRLTAAERLALPPNGTIALQQLVTAGYVVITNGVGFVTDQTWTAARHRRAADDHEPHDAARAGRHRLRPRRRRQTRSGSSTARRSSRRHDGRARRHVARDLRPHARPARPVGDADDQRAAARGPAQRAGDTARQRDRQHDAADGLGHGDRRAGRRGRPRPARSSRSAAARTRTRRS